jgi:hypothetical protein
MAIGDSFERLSATFPCCDAKLLEHMDEIYTKHYFNGRQKETEQHKVISTP